RVDLDLAAVRARDGHLVPNARELVERMRQLRRPEADRPTGRRRRPRVRDDHQYMRSLRCRHVDDLVMLIRALYSHHLGLLSTRSLVTVRSGDRVEQAEVVVRQQDLLVDCSRTLVGVATPDLRQMRYFATVVERGSFTAAAQELHVAQQAVSQQVKALEQTLGVALLVRSPRHVTVTREGEIFLADCRRVLADADRATERVQAAARGEAGTLRLVYTLVSAFDTIPVILDRLGTDLPHVKVDAREVYGCDVAALLLDGDCDIGASVGLSNLRAPLGRTQA